MRVDIYIGGTKVDLFADENIDVVSSVADIEDITKNTTDYTKTFTVAATKNNNKIFKHWYNADVDNSFDARIKVDGEIKLDGMRFRIGKFRLSKVAVKKGYPTSYTINFWGNLVDLKDILGKDELSDLDLSAYNDGYNSSNVWTGLVNGRFTDRAMVYNLLAKKQYYYSSDVTDTTQTDELSNIAWGDGSGLNGVVWSDLSPSLRLIKVIEAIEADYSLTFSRDFFGRTEFNDLYVWLNNNKNGSVGKNSVLVDFNAGDFNYINNTTNIGSYPVVRSTNQYFNIYIALIPKAGFEDIDYTIKIFKNGELDVVKDFVDGAGGIFIPNYLNIGDIATDTFTHEVYLEVEASSYFEYDLQFNQVMFIGTTQDNVDTTYANNITQNAVVDIANNLPKMKIIDFLKGLFKMFKLVVIPQDDGSLYVDTFDSFYAAGSVYDVTRYIDNDSYDVERGKILNEINFLFSEPTTILNQQFEKNTRVAYGDAEIKLTDEQDAQGNEIGTLLDGDKLEFTLPFEQILYERLNDQVDGELTNAQYGAIIDESLNPVNPKLHIFYNIWQPIGSKTIGFINQFGVKENLTVNINTPSHTIGFDSSNYSMLFDSEFSTWGGEKINNTLYTNYHEAYIQSIFNIKKRSFKYKAKNLPLRIMLDLQLNDLLKIRDTFYRIDKFTSNLLTGEVSLDLINSFTDTINSFDATPSSFNVTYEAQQVSSNITNLVNFTTNKIDLGFGTDWVAISTVGTNMYFDIDVNELETFRDMSITVTNTDTLQEVSIYINQSVGLALASSNVITADSDIITADNG